MINQLSAKCQFGAIHTADTTCDGWAPNPRKSMVWYGVYLFNIIVHFTMVHFTSMATHHYNILGGCPFNGPLRGTKYPTRAASPIQTASTPKSSLPFSKHRSCALVLVEHCTEFRTSFISN